MPKYLQSAAATKRENTRTTTYNKQQKTIIAKGAVVLKHELGLVVIGNKLSGVARVTKIHHPSVDESADTSIKYDVAYVLGGSEHRVDESFIMMHNVDEPSTNIYEFDDRKLTTERKNVDGQIQMIQSLSMRLVERYGTTTRTLSQEKVMYSCRNNINTRTSCTM